jgi:hypothetical protein
MKVGVFARELPRQMYLAQVTQGSFDSAERFASESFGCAQDDIQENIALQEK